jgi:cytoskeletal protein CcmA (bactofilin family)
MSTLSPQPRSVPRRVWPLLLLALVLALWITPVAALERRSGDNVGLEAGQTVDDDLALAGTTITVAGRVTGDLFVAGTTIIIAPTAQIDGDVFAAGTTVTVNGTINGSLRSASNTLLITGAIGRNVLAAANQITLGSGATVKGNWLSGAASGLLQGTIGGTVTMGAESLHLAGPIGRNAEIVVENLTVLPGARVAGNLTYTSEREQVVPAGAVQGAVQHLIPPARPREERRGFEVFGFVVSLILLAGGLLVGLLLAWLVPGLYRAAQGVVEREALTAFAVGLVTLIVVPILAIILLFTGVGIPLGLLSLGAYLSSLYIGWLVAATALAGLLVGLARRGGQPIGVGWLVVLGLLGLYVVTAVPYLGGLVGFVVLCLGLGILVILIARYRPRPTPMTPVPVAPVPPTSPLPSEAR